MAWVVDTCVLLDVLEADPTFGEGSVACLERRRSAGLVVCPVSFVELAPAFLGDAARQADFLGRLGAVFDEPWTAADTRAAHRGWFRQVEMRKAGQAPRRPVADILIGAFASRFQGLITRNPADFKQPFPALKLVVPTP